MKPNMIFNRLHVAGAVLNTALTKSNRLSHTLGFCTVIAASQWFCNGSVYTEPSLIHAYDSVIVLYGSVIVL